jgi:DNA-binding MarR family transcriptional regulator
MNSDSVNSESVADALNSAMIHLLRRAAREDQAAGIGPAQLSALSVLVFGGDTTLGRLAAAEHVRPPTMTRIVAALEAAGLVRKEPSADDRRSVRIRATPAGRRLMQMARQRRIRALAARLDGLPADDLDTLARAAALMEEAAR